eukprot:gene6270-6912_t
MQGTKYDHLQFFNHSASSSSSPPLSSSSGGGGGGGGGGVSGGLRLGGENLVPGLRIGENKTTSAVSSSSSARTAIEKHAEIVDYLKSLPPGAKATPVDIQRVLNIDLSSDVKVLNMLKSNPKVESTFNNDGDVSFIFRPKFIVTDRKDLLDTIDRVASGILLSEIQDCYPGLEDEVMEMIISGDIIAIKNKEAKTLVLYPRGTPFYSQLSGTVTARPGDLLVTTSLPLQTEIRRGEAIKIGDYWYRLSTAIKGPGKGSTRSTSVLLDKEITLGSKADFLHPFAEKTLPLDGDFEGEAVYQGVAYRHGCTADLQDLWRGTQEEVRKAQGSDQEIAQRLVSLNLLSQQFLQRSVHIKRSADSKNSGPKKRAKRLRESQMHSGGFGVNAHLRGTKLAKVLQETREALHRADHGDAKSNK